jgi:spoIIIJ-associated protein
MRGSARVEARVKPRAIRPKNDRGRSRRTRSNDSRGRSSRGKGRSDTRGKTRSNRNSSGNNGNKGGGQRRGGGGNDGGQQGRDNQQAQQNKSAKGTDKSGNGRGGSGSGSGSKSGAKAKSKGGGDGKNAGKGDKSNGNTSAEQVLAASGTQSGSKSGGRRRGNKSGGKSDNGGNGSGKGKSQANNKSEKNNNRADEKVIEETPMEEVAEHLRTFLGGLTEAFGLEGDVAIDDSETDVLVATVEGQHGLMVGPKGRTLDAIQELARVSSQRTAPSSIRIRVDVGGYRTQRAAALAGFARKAADKAIDNAAEVSLEPMSPADRKSVHDALSEDDRVETRSVGTEPRRRIIVIPTVDAPTAESEEE